MQRCHGYAGFSLVELMVALLLGLLTIAASGSVFLAAAASHRENDGLGRMQDSLRFAMAELSRDLEMAGYYAQLRDPAAQVTLDASVAAGYAMDSCDAAWVFGDRAPLQTRGNATPAAAHAAFPCIATSEFQQGTDVVSVKRLRGACVDPRSDADGDGEEDGHGRYFLRTDGALAVLYRHLEGVDPPAPGGRPCAPTAATGTVEVYEYVPAIWYVRRYPVGRAAPNPSLCRKALKGAVMEAECVVEGIEDLQLEFGIDGNADGVADWFASFDEMVPAALQPRIVALRVHLLARSPRADPAYRSLKAFRLGNREHPAALDGHYRRLLSSIVLVRNAASRMRPVPLAG